MSLKKMILMLFIAVATLSVLANALIFSLLTDTYFKAYLDDNYETHVNQIIAYTQKELKESPDNFSQLRVDLESHLYDPIIRIKLYDDGGGLIADVTSQFPMMMGGGRMANSRMGINGAEEVKQYVLSHDNGDKIGTLNITKVNSLVALQVMRQSLMKNALIAIVVSSLIAFVLGRFISERVGKDLTTTVDLSNAIMIDEVFDYNHSSLKEISQLQMTLEDLKARLSLKAKGRKILIDELTHQTRTPLTVLKSHLEGVEDGVIEMDASEIKLLTNQIDHLTLIINNLANMIDGVREVTVYQEESVRILPLINEIIEGLMPQFRQKNLEVIKQYDDDFEVYTDPYLLSQAVYNLLTNAYKYSLTNTRVIISIKHNQGDVVIGIKDFGIGIKASDRDRITSAYYRGDNARDKRGDGIGLYLVSENITRLGGSLHIESEINVGSYFEIRLSKDGKHDEKA